MANEGFLGGNVDQMRDLQKKFDASKARLEDMSRKLVSKGKQVDWKGPDANRFKDSHLNEIKSCLSQAVQLLGSGSTALGRNISAQETASNQS